MSDTAVKRIDVLIDTFEDACRCGPVPDVLSYVERAGPADRLRLLFELVRLELEYTLRAGQTMRVEDCLIRYPEFAAERANVLGLIVLEARVRQGCSQMVPLEEYFTRFPGYRDELAKLFSELGEPAAQVPGYEIFEKIGRGGMGVVYRARDLRLNRLVALKMIRAGVHADEEDRARFRREAEAIARLQHPGVVQIYEIGENDGRPFFALEFCSGGSLDHKLAEGPLQPGAAALLVATVAHAIQAAHDAKVLHRDLKPANVLLAGDGMPKVTDFGLAKRLDDDAQTQSGAIMGTPSYMAPEQAAGRTKELGPQTDVYSLGAILYECLTGRPPFRAATPLDTVMQVVSSEPVPPTLLNAQVPADLETICLNCLRKERERRYARAADLALDLERFLRGEPVQARPVGKLERSWRWCKRNPAMAALTFGLVTALLAGIIVSTWFALEAQNNATIAVQKAANEGRARKDEEKARKDAERQKARADKEAAAKALESQRANDEAKEKTQETRRAEQALLRAQAYLLKAAPFVFASDPVLAREMLHDYTTYPINRRDLIWHFHERAFSKFSGPQFWHAQKPCSLSWNAEGDHLAVGLVDGTVRVWNIADHTAQILRGHHGPVTAVAFHPKKDEIVSGGPDGKIIIWNAKTLGKVATLSEHTAPVIALAFSSAGGFLLSGSHDGSALLWDFPAKKRQLKIDHASAFGRDTEEKAKRIVTAALSPDGSILATAGVSAAIALWNANTGAHHGNLTSLNMGDVASLAFSADEKMLASCGKDEKVRLWNVAERSQAAVLGEHIGATAVRFSPDGKNLVSVGTDKTVRLWDLHELRQRTQIRALAAPLLDVAISPDGQTVATAGQDGSVKLWNIGKRPDFAYLKHDSAFRSLDISRDGMQLAVGDWMGLVLVIDPSSGKVLHRLKGHKGMVNAVSFSADGKLLASGGQDNTLRLWNPQTGSFLAALKQPNNNAANSGLSTVESLVFNPQGTLLASGDFDKTIKLWDVKKRTLLTTLHGHTSSVQDLAFSPNGKILASAGADNDVRLWDVQKRKNLARLQGHTQPVECVAFSPDGKTLASGGQDNRVRFWDLATFTQSASTIEHADSVNSISYSPDGKILVTGDSEGMLRIWSPDAAQAQFVLAGHTGYIRAVCISKDGKLMVSAGGQGAGKGEIHIRRLTSGPLVATFPGKGVPYQAVSFSSGGDAILALEEKGLLASLDLAAGTFSGKPTSLGTCRCACFSLDGNLLAWSNPQGKLHWQNIATGKTDFIADASAEPLLALACNSDGTFLAGHAQKSSITVWDLRSKHKKIVCAQSQGAGLPLCFQPGGLLLGGVAADGSAALWHSQTGEKMGLQGQLSSIRCLAFSRDGKRLAAGDEDGRILVWTLAEKAPPLEMSGHSAAVTALAFSRDGLQLLSGGEDRTIRQWHSGNGRRLAIRSGQIAPIAGLIFHPHQPNFLSVDRQGTILYWQDNVPRSILKGP